MYMEHIKIFYVKRYLTVYNIRIFEMCIQMLMFAYPNYVFSSSNYRKLKYVLKVYKKK